MSNSARLGILLSLYVVRESTFADLLRIIEIPKSSLFSHLQVLQDAGLVTVKKKFTVSGPRTFVRITEKGTDKVKGYLDVMRDFERT
ncbi:transcriptional regulator [Sulfuracidifex metallicus]|uniref:transcriptional regulator n=1 Tax=Sulfuracidifex metallicus TaxID=47303 RepID=UPI002275A08C|nr:transcriptional regulator [Sulfuracidifex metallicus]MCY0849687.1 transcriptional regulator [Sulfuracidifex metallicus]